MKLDAYSTDPQMQNLCINVEQVKLDGEIVRMCFACDDERGYVDVYAESDREGNDVFFCGELLTHRLWGKVEIVMKSA